MTEATNEEGSEALLASERDNAVYLYSSNITAVAYLANTFSISSGQPSTLPPDISQEDDGGWKINVRCGRHKTSEMAQQFVNLCGGQDCIYNDEAWTDRTPSDLNFYLAFSVTFVTGRYSKSLILYLGQGSRGTSENWWIGSTALANKGSHPVIIPLVGFDVDEVTPLTYQVFSIKYKKWDEISFENWFSDDA